MGLGDIRREDELANDPLADFHVWWMDVDLGDIRDFEAVLATAQDEEPLQSHLTAHPILLSQFLTGGHGRWVLPKASLAGTYIPDFVIGHRYSGPSWEWKLVELQSPQLRTRKYPRGTLFTKAGDPCEQLREGIRQVREWRRWLELNLDLARRSPSRDGLGLTDISASPKGVIFIGREESLTSADADKRKQIASETNIEIRTYDSLVRHARMRAEAEAGSRSRGRPSAS